jgi:hypothetical protein
MNPPGFVGLGMALPLLSSAVMSFSALKVTFSKIEDPCSPDSSGQGIFDRQEVCHFSDTLANPKAS